LNSIDDLRAGKKAGYYRRDLTLYQEELLEEMGLTAKKRLVLVVGRNLEQSIQAQGIPSTVTVGSPSTLDDLEQLALAID
jgi:hypothetical protein